MKKSNLFVLTLLLVLSGKAYSQEVPEPTLEELKQQADAVLDLSNVSARKKIDVVFKLADRLLKTEQPDLAEKYLYQGLQTYPWDLEHQIVYAKLLASKGQADLSKETANIVLKYAETEKLIEEAKLLLGMPPQPATFNDETPDQTRLLKRATMQALSSIGFIYGVERCTNPTCARAYPHSLSEHDAKEGVLCPQCRKGFKNIFEPIK